MADELTPLEWKKKYNNRRIELIDKEEESCLTPEETKELEKLRSEAAIMGKLHINRPNSDNDRSR